MEVNPELEASDRSEIRSTRRNLLFLGAAVGAGGLLGAAATSNAETPKTPESAVWLNVKDFGAVGDAATDDAAAFMRALEAAEKQGGATVFAPSGRYLFKSTLSLPKGVTLRGTFTCVPSHSGIRDHGQTKPGDDGTAFFVTAGKGDENGTPFVTINENSCLCGVCIYYPEQIVDNEPQPYPWTIAMRGNNPAVSDVELLNSFRGIDASKNARHNIRNITGQPLRCGIWVDEIYDIGRIENVHFNPWWCSRGPLYKWQIANGEAFVFGRSDWEYVLNTFCFGYHIGYRFIETRTGVCNGNLLGIGADDCYRSVLVDQSAAFGLLIANGEFTSFHGEDPTMVEVSASNHGVVRFANSAFWGPCNQIARIDGRGTVGFSDCTFCQWGRDGDRPAILANSGAVLVNGCEFRQRGQHIAIAPAVDRAVITGNLFSGPIRIQNQTHGDVQIGLNAATH